MTSIRPYVKWKYRHPDDDHVLLEESLSERDWELWAEGKLPRWRDRSPTALRFMSNEEYSAHKKKRRAQQTLVEKTMSSDSLLVAKIVARLAAVILLRKAQVVRQNKEMLYRARLRLAMGNMSFTRRQVLQAHVRDLRARLRALRAFPWGRWTSGELNIDEVIGRWHRVAKHKSLGIRDNWSRIEALWNNRYGPDRIARGPIRGPLTWIR
jgi:hypothetical protein